MPSVRQPLLLPPQGVAFPDGNNGMFFGQTLQTPFTTVYIYAINVANPSTSQGTSTDPSLVQSTAVSMQLLGGIQSWRPTEGTAPQLMYETGTDWIEFIMQPRPWEVTFTRRIPRGYDIRSIMRRIYGNVQDVDFRALPVVLQAMYNQTDPSGSHVVMNASWTFAQGIIGPVVGPYWSSPYSPQMEDITFTGRGIAYTDSGGNFYNNLEQYWGTAPATA